MDFSDYASEYEAILDTLNYLNQGLRSSDLDGALHVSYAGFAVSSALEYVISSLKGLM